MNILTDKTSDRKNDRRQKLLIIILLLIILLLILGYAIVFELMGGGADPDFSPNGGVWLELDPSAGEYVEQNNRAAQGVAIPGWGSITIPADTANVAVDFYNPEDNAGLYYLTFELRLTDDSEQGYEVLYTSGLIAPGLHVQSAALSRELEAGEYDAVIHVQPYSMNGSLTPTNNADLKTKLIVKQAATSR